MVDSGEEPSELGAYRERRRDKDKAERNRFVLGPIFFFISKGKRENQVMVQILLFYF